MSELFVEGIGDTDSSVTGQNPVIKTGALSINRSTRAVLVSGNPLYLTDKEFSVLAILMRRKGETLTKQMIMENLYHGANPPKLRIIDVLICKLRKKLSALSGGETFIDTIWGRGYIIRDIVVLPETDDQTVEHMAAA